VEPAADEKGLFSFFLLIICLKRKNFFSFSFENSHADPGPRQVVPGSHCHPRGGQGVDLPHQDVHSEYAWFGASFTPAIPIEWPINIVFNRQAGRQAAGCCRLGSR